MTLRRTAFAVAVVVGAIGLGLATGAYASQANSPSSTSKSSQALSVVVHPLKLLFVTSAGTSSSFPTGPLQPGDRVLGTDAIIRRSATIGVDYEFCTVTFALYALCDDMVELNGGSNLRVSWTFQWPSTGTTGPAAFDGVVLGGTRTYKNASGTFHTLALPNHDLRLVAQITTP